MADVTTFSTPDGPFTLALQDGAVIAAGWTADVATLWPQVHAHLRPAHWNVVDPAGAAVDAVLAYYSGDLSAPSRIRVRQQSGPFREQAWEVLRQVQPGTPLSYAQYAAAIGNPSAFRAAASACAQNAVALFVPCHRVVRTDGGLGGFRWGVGLKERLLERERSAQQ